MTAAIVMDIISRLPGCAGQAADAVSAYTQVKMEDAPALLKNPKSECPKFGFVFHDTNGLNHGPVWKTQLFLSESVRSSFGRSIVGKAIRECFLETRLGTFSELTVYLTTERKDCSCLCMWTKKIRLERSRTSVQHGELLTKDVDLGEPTSFLDCIFWLHSTRMSNK